MDSKKKEMNKKLWKGPIENKELALHIVKSTAMAFYIVAGLQVVAAIVLAAAFETSPVGTILGAVIIALLALWLQKSNSRAAAIILLILSSLSALGALFALLVGNFISIILAVLLLWLSIRATQATGYLAKKGSGGTPSPTA